MSAIGGNLTSVVISVAVTVIVLVAIFSIVPRIMTNFSCPAITGDTNSDFVKDAGENWTEQTDVIQWKQSCSDLKQQTTIVPILLALVVILAVLIIVTRLLS